MLKKSVIAGLSTKMCPLKSVYSIHISILSVHNIMYIHSEQSSSTGTSECCLLCLSLILKTVKFHSTCVLSVYPSCVSHSPAVDEVQWWFMIPVRTAGISARAMSSLCLNLSLLGSCTKMLLCRGQVKGGSMAMVAGCGVPASPQLLQIEPVSDADQSRWSWHGEGADPLTLHFVLPKWTWCQWKHLVV